MTVSRRCRSASSKTSLTKDSRRMLQSWLAQTEIGGEPSSRVQLATTRPELPPHLLVCVLQNENWNLAALRLMFNFCIFCIFSCGAASETL